MTNADKTVHKESIAEFVKKKAKRPSTTSRATRISFVSPSQPKEKIVTINDTGDSTVRNAITTTLSAQVTADVSTYAQEYGTLRMSKAVGSGKGINFPKQKKKKYSLSGPKEGGKRNKGESGVNETDWARSLPRLVLTPLLEETSLQEEQAMVMVSPHVSPSRVPQTSAEIFGDDAQKILNARAAYIQIDASISSGAREEVQGSLRHSSPLDQIKHTLSQIIRAYWANREELERCAAIVSYGISSRSQSSSLAAQQEKMESLVAEIKKLSDENKRAKARIEKQGNILDEYVFNHKELMKVADRYQDKVSILEGEIEKTEETLERTKETLQVSQEKNKKLEEDAYATASQMSVFLSALETKDAALGKEKEDAAAREVKFEKEFEEARQESFDLAYIMGNDEAKDVLESLFPELFPGWGPDNVYAFWQRWDSANDAYRQKKEQEQEQARLGVENSPAMTDTTP